MGQAGHGISISLSVWWVAVQGFFFFFQFIALMFSRLWSGYLLEHLNGAMLMSIITYAFIEKREEYLSVYIFYLLHTDISFLVFPPATVLQDRIFQVSISC